ncbi:hypothetical protein [Kribbella catacumbae]|uniref:hypothetical protein n=1 Tax=Kribbella catacumbae TaxID=460086 RepID=UPI0003691DA4|nr:hypothetical protein [Kribbella catacumbae]
MEFPGGRVVGAKVPWDQAGAVKKATDTRVADVRFVLDSLPRLPRRLSRAMDLSRIGMFLGTVDPEVAVAFTRRALEGFFRHSLKP